MDLEWVISTDEKSWELEMEPRWWGSWKALVGWAISFPLARRRAGSSRVGCTNNPTGTCLNTPLDDPLYHSIPGTCLEPPSMKTFLVLLPSSHNPGCFSTMETALASLRGPIGKSPDHTEATESTSPAFPVVFHNRQTRLLGILHPHNECSIHIPGTTFPWNKTHSWLGRTKCT